jgi:FkbM family methyltransferase
LPWEVRLHRKLAGRLPMRISARDQVISKAIFSTGEWEPLELGFIRQHVRPGMTAVDVGANIGAHTLTMADSVGSQGAVHCFEPTPVFETLRHNVRRNGFESRVILNNCAVGASEGVAKFGVCKPGYELFTSRGVPLADDCSTGESAEYPMTTLDAYARKAGLDHIDFLKVDVEGGEVDVFRGASGLLRAGAVDCILFEVADACLRSTGSSAAALLDSVRDAGYELALLDPGGATRAVPRDTSNLLANVVATPSKKRPAAISVSGSKAERE